MPRARKGASVAKKNTPAITDLTGLGLADFTARTTPRHYVHASDDGANGWKITSDTPLDGILDADVLDRIFPGRLGTYVYPIDAVFHRCDRTHTTRACFEDIVTMEAALVEEQRSDDEERIHHMTVKGDDDDSSGLVAPHEGTVHPDEASDADEYTTEEEEDDEDEAGEGGDCGDCGDDPEGACAEEDDGDPWCPSDEEDVQTSTFTRVTRSGSVENRGGHNNSRDGGRNDTSGADAGDTSSTRRGNSHT